MPSAPSLRMLVVSDLHVDHLENRARAAELSEALVREDADVLIVAGDISHKLDQVDAALVRLESFVGPKMFVAGNHDVWRVRPRAGDPPDSWARLRALSGICRRHGFTDLQEENLTVKGFTFVGSIGWYDYSFASPGLGFTDAQYAEKRWNDLTYMDRDYAQWGMTDAAVVERLAAAVEKKLREAEDPIVFVSHHVPLEELVLRRGHASWDFFNAYMGSRRLEEVVRARGVRRFVFGHTHRPVTLIESGRFVLNNPLGYPRQALTPVRRPFLVT